MYFTLANARQFYLSTGTRLGVTGLINFLVNPVTAVVALKYFTLANARRFYFSTGKRLGITGLMIRNWIRNNNSKLSLNFDKLGFRRWQVM